MGTSSTKGPAWGCFLPAQVDSAPRAEYHAVSKRTSVPEPSGPPAVEKAWGDWRSLPGRAGWATGEGSGPFMEHQSIEIRRQIDQETLDHLGSALLHLSLTLQQLEWAF